jgi:pilus assembly protein Flp/PilA
MRGLISSFLKARSGATAIEYGLIAALIAVVIITSIGTVGQNLLQGIFNDVANGTG